VDGVRGGQSSAGALRCPAVHLNPTNKRRRGPGCVVPELKGEVKFSGRGDFTGGDGCLWHTRGEQAAERVLARTS
jgi:hypothetical protein